MEKDEENRFCDVVDVLLHVDKLNGLSSGNENRGLVGESTSVAGVSGEESYEAGCGMMRLREGRCIAELLELFVESGEFKGFDELLREIIEVPGLGYGWYQGVEEDRE